MASVLWGFPEGIVEHTKDKNLRMQTLALQSDTALDPARQAKMEAEARGTHALAQEREDTAAQMAEIAHWRRKAAEPAPPPVTKESLVQERLETAAVEVPLVTGQQQTVNMLPTPGQPSNAFLMQAKAMKDAGAPPHVFAEMLEKGTEIANQNSMISWRASQKKSKQLEDQIAQAKRVGELFHDIQTGGNAAWLYYCGSPAHKDLIPEEMCGKPYNKDLIDIIARQATTAVQEQELELKETTSRLNKDKLADTKLRSKHLNAVSEQQVQTAKDTADRKAKYDGYQSQTHKDAAEIAIKTKEHQMVVEDSIYFPYLPIVASEVEVGESYKTKEGLRVYAYDKDEDGMPLFTNVLDEDAKRYKYEGKNDTGTIMKYARWLMNQ